MKFPAIITKPTSTAIVLLVSLLGIVIGKDVGKAGVEWLLLASPLETRVADMLHGCGTAAPLLNEGRIEPLRCVFEFGWRDKELNVVKERLMTTYFTAYFKQPGKMDNPLNAWATPLINACNHMSGAPSAESQHCLIDVYFATAAARAAPAPSTAPYEPPW
jgi:hypothetical protein